MKNSLKKNFWPALSITLLFTFFSLSFYLFIAFEEKFFVYAFIVILNLLILSIIFFLDIIGVKKRIWSSWRSFPIFAHKIICIICIIWISLLSLKGLIPAIKKEYEKR